MPLSVRIETLLIDRESAVGINIYLILYYSNVWNVIWEHVFFVVVENIALEGTVEVFHILHTFAMRATSETLKKWRQKFWNRL